MAKQDDTKKLRLGVLLSGGGRTLVNIDQCVAAGKLAAEVAVVIASRECKGLQRSKDAGHDVHLVPYKQMPDTETYSGEICRILDAARRHAGPLAPWRMLAEEGKQTLAEALDSFDYRKRGGFASYATWALMRTFARTVPESSPPEG